MVKINLKFLDKKIKKKDKGDFIRHLEKSKEYLFNKEYLFDKPQTEFQEDVYKKISPHISNIDKYLIETYRINPPVKEVDLIIPNFHSGHCVWWLKPPKIFLAIDENKWKKYGNLIYLMHEFGHIYQRFHLENLKVRDKESSDKTHAVIELLCDFNLRKKLLNLDLNVDHYLCGHDILTEYRKEIFEKYWNDWETKKIKNVYKFFDKSIFHI